MFQTKKGTGFTNRPAMLRSQRMEEQGQGQKSDSPKPQASSGGHKSVTIHHDGKQFHVMGGADSKTHADIDSALKHAKAIFGGHSGSDDTAYEAGGEDAAVPV